MKTRRLGRSPIYVSEICMGTMTFGSGADEAMSHRIMDESVEAGINFFDTAENYPVPPKREWAGETENIVGRWMKGKDRDSLIIATKVSGPSHGWIASSQRAGMTAMDRHNIVKALDDSLKRLQTDYIDLYQTHWPDHGTAYDETMEVNNFSMNNRRFEDELAQVCIQEGVSLIPYSPLGGGALSGKYNDGAMPEGARFSAYLKMGGRQAKMAERFVNPKSEESTKRFMAIADELGVAPVTLATAWSKQHDFVASTIVGATHTDQLPEIFAAADLVLSDEIMKRIYKISREIMYPMG